MTKQILDDIKNMREQKGSELEVLEMINNHKKEYEKSGDYKGLVKLHWEEALTWQHIAMMEKSSEIPDETRINDAVQNMETASVNADKIIEENNLGDMKIISLRFLGRMYDYKNDFVSSESMYRRALQLLQTAQDKTSSLEISGFLAFSLANQGKIKESFDMAVNVFKDFEESETGIALKNRDYVTWAIWISGVFSRLAGVYQLNREQLDWEEYKKYIEKSEHYLTDPEGPITWGGNDPFAYRKKEFEALKRNITIILIAISSLFHLK